MHAPAFLAATLFLGTLRLSANDTALNEGGYGPSPVGGLRGPESVVRMQSEELHIAFGKKWTEVDAKFVFRNTKKDAPAVQIVGFPDIGAAQIEARRRDPKGEKIFAIEQETPLSGVLHGMRTRVNGVEQKSKLRYGWVKEIDEIDTPVEKPDKTTGLMAWHALEVTFPPGQDVTVERHYRTESGSQVYGIHFYYYTTATGGVWQGTIGRLQADVTLKDGLKIDDLAWHGAKLPRLQSYEGSLVTKPNRKEWQILSPTQMRLVWENFEPRTEKNRRGFEVVTKADEVPPGEQ
ncbi:MAG: hypothetical protein ABJF10_27250 [Chthoniobacter sp.]|uniref:hypothetical protein n=1 Tax=Chthoniobacter sp. TaxID=2510640 RepID=UPI0032A525F7